jgi:hypothetical protein
MPTALLRRNLPGESPGVNEDMVRGRDAKTTGAMAAALLTGRGSQAYARCN